MTSPFNPVTVPALSAHDALVHGSSPRRIAVAGGRNQVLDFSGSAGPGRWENNVSAYFSALGIAGTRVFGVRQVHGDTVHVLDSPVSSRPGAGPVSADAIVTRLTELPIAVLTADCIPAILYDPCRHVAGVVHAGRLGTALNILSKSVRALKDHYGSRPDDLVVGMGPGICGACYEVDSASVEPFRWNYDGWGQWATAKPGGKFLLDLFAANREDAERAGVPSGQIHATGLCTSCQNDRFFSYRKEGASGRMMTLAMLASRPRKAP